MKKNNKHRFLFAKFIDIMDIIVYTKIKLLYFYNGGLYNIVIKNCFLAKINRNLIKFSENGVRLFYYSSDL